MFHDLKEAYQEMLKKHTHVVDDNGVHITFPEELWSAFEQEFMVCFIEEDDDVMFQRWQDGYEECMDPEKWDE
jgi:hypothetical protein